MDKEQELLNSSRMMYEQIKSYDLHYSNIRTSVSTFLLTTSLGLGSYLLGQGYYALGLFMPTILLCISILNNRFFVYVMGKCAKKAGTLETLISTLSQGEKTIKVEGIEEPLTISKYIEDKQALVFRTKFDETIKEFDPFKGFPNSFFEEVGVASTTIITLLYFFLVCLVWSLS